jgi:hypothetical protein
VNNSTLYRNDVNALTRAIFPALMGDPTLRMDMTPPPGTLQGISSAAGEVQLNWTAAADPVLGYHVYRSASETGPFDRLTGDPIPGTTFADQSPLGGVNWYMVRAVRLEQTPSGSYYNASQGVFTGVTAAVPALPIVVKVSSTNTGVTLTWNSHAGIDYRVLGCDDPATGGWSDVSGTLTATGDSVSWTGSQAREHRYYRVASP